MLNAAVSARAAELAAQFQRRDPFRQFVIDGFFDAATCARLMAEFPGGRLELSRKLTVLYFYTKDRPTLARLNRHNA